MGNSPTLGGRDGEERALHLRIIAPADQAQSVVDLLTADEGVTHLVVLPGRS